MSAFSLISLVLIVATIGAALYQLRANHEWNRRKAAQDAILNKVSLNDETISRPLIAAFNHIADKDPISLDDINSAIAAEDGEIVRRAIHAYLNSFEAIARGVEHHIYDKDVIGDACGDLMTRVFSRYYNYIEHRRNNGSPRAWRFLERFSQEWTRAKEPKKSRRRKTA